jgi:hypothetical protein
MSLCRNARKRIESLRVKMPEWCLAPSEELVRDFEREFRLSLPADYCCFLSEYGGCFIEAKAPIQEPTPFGRWALVEHFFGFVPPDRCSRGVAWNTHLIGGAGVGVAIATGSFDDMVWLKCTGSDAGCVYCHAADQRWLWPDSKFREMSKNLHPDIEHYLLLRRQGRLPIKKKGYENHYRLAGSFTEFIHSLQPRRRSYQ